MLRSRVSEDLVGARDLKLMSMSAVAEYDPSMGMLHRSGLIGENRAKAAGFRQYDRSLMYLSAFMIPLCAY